MRLVDSELNLEVWVSAYETDGWEWCVVKWNLDEKPEFEVFGSEKTYKEAKSKAEKTFEFFGGKL